MSSTRSRSGGRWDFERVDAKHQVFAEVAFLDHLFQIRGASRRRRARRPGTTRCRRRGESRRFPGRAAVWPASLLGSSPISSRNSVPPLATSNRPTRCSSAPVKAPLRCPNSSLSIRLSGRAPQLIATNGISARRLWSCSAAGDQFLAGAGFAQDQHGGVGRRDLGDQRADALHGRPPPIRLASPSTRSSCRLSARYLFVSSRFSATRCSSDSSSTSLQGLVR